HSGPCWKVDRPREAGLSVDGGRDVLKNGLALITASRRGSGCRGRHPIRKGAQQQRSRAGTDFFNCVSPQCMKAARGEEGKSNSALRRYGLRRRWRRGTNNNSRGRWMSDAPNDSDLVRRIRAGEAQAEVELTRRFERGITQILVRQTRNFALAQELCQETLIIVLKRLRTQPLTQPEKLAAFIAQTARNLAIAERRKERRRRTDTTDTDEFADVPDE